MYGRSTHVNCILIDNILFLTGLIKSIIADWFYHILLHIEAIQGMKIIMFKMEILLDMLQLVINKYFTLILACIRLF